MIWYDGIGWDKLQVGKEVKLGKGVRKEEGKGRHEKEERERKREKQSVIKSRTAKNHHTLVQEQIAELD